MTVPAASFRDPTGSCGVVGERVFRLLDEGAAGCCEAFLRSAGARRFLEERSLVATRRLAPAEAEALAGDPAFQATFGTRQAAAVLEHERIWFPSYPYEWAPEMLWEAARLTLHLARDLLEEGYGLKDATPYNVLFRGPEPVFVDATSFERRVAGDPMWRPYGQFVRTFLLPLLASQRWGARLSDIFLTRRDGLEPEEIYRLCGFFERLHPRVLALVTLPTWLRGHAQRKGQSLYRQEVLANPEKAHFLLDSLLGRMNRALSALAPKSQNSNWSDYMSTHSYSEPAFAAKERFVGDWLKKAQPRRVLDVGANIGHFSALAARVGASVVAIDLDDACVGGIWRRAHQEHLDILPLTVDLSRPTPATGWLNNECPSFLNRAKGAFDCALMLAVVHHLQVTERVPLEQIMALAAEVSTSLVLVEYVGPQDAMFRQLVRGREHLHAGYSEAVFEQACRARFEILESLPLPGTQRRIYALKPRGGTP